VKREVTIEKPLRVAVDNEYTTPEIVIETIIPEKSLVEQYLGTESHFSPQAIVVKPSHYVSHYRKEVEDKKEIRKSEKRKIVLKTHQKPLHTYMEHDDFALIAWICAGVFLVLLAVAVLNSLLGGITTVAIIFFVAAGVVGLAAAVFLILAIISY
jgi:hypothetical protein